MMILPNLKIISQKIASDAKDDQLLCCRFNFDVASGFLKESFVFIDCGV